MNYQKSHKHSKLVEKMNITKKKTKSKFFVDLSQGDRFFTTTDEKTYTCPSCPRPLNTNLNAKKNLQFLDRNGNFFNCYYQKIYDFDQKIPNENENENQNQNQNENENPNQNQNQNENENENQNENENENENQNQNENENPNQNENQNKNEYQNKNENEYENESTFNSLKNLSKFPDPENYTTFEQFEQAAFQWKNEILEKLGDAKLPHVLGRVYPRPTFHSETIFVPKNKSGLHSEIESHRTSSETKKSVGRNSSSSFTRFEMIESDSIESFKSIESDLIENDTQKFVPEFYENTQLLAKPSEKWNNELISSAPESYLFDKIEEYEMAYINWANNTLSTISHLPPHPKQFVEMYGLQTAEEKQKQETKKRLQQFIQNPKVKKLTKQQLKHFNYYYIWMKKISKFFVYHSISNGKSAINNLKQQLKEEEKPQSTIEQNNKENENQPKANFIQQKDLNLNEIIHFFANEDNQENKKNEADSSDEKERISDEIESILFQEIPDNKSENSSKEEEDFMEIDTQFEQSTQDNDFFFCVEQTSNAPVNTSFESKPKIAKKKSKNKEEKAKRKQKQKEKELFVYFLEKIIRLQNKNTRKYGSIHKPLVGKVPYIIIYSNGSTFGSVFKNENPALDKANFWTCRNDPIFGLRRSDLDEDMKNSSFQLPKELSETQVHFYFPVDDHAELLNFKLIRKKGYLQEVRKLIESMDQPDHLEQLKSISNSNQYSKLSYDSQKKEVERILNSKKPFEISQLKQILYYPMSFDFFKKLIAEELTYNYEVQTFGRVFLSIISTENFSEILALLNDSCSLLTQSKISQLVFEGLQMNYARTLLRQYANNNSLKNLYYIAYSLNLLSKKYNSIFPFSREIHNIYRITASKTEMKDLYFETIFLTHYYLSVIQNKTSSEVDLFLFANLQREITAKLKELEKQLDEILKKNTVHVEKRLFMGISSRFISISEFYSFILEKFLNHSDESIIKTLQSQDINLLGNIRQISKSRFSHVQFASKKFWATFVSDPQWQKFLVSKYSKDYFTLITDFKPPEIIKQNEENTQEDKEMKKGSLMNFLVYVFLKVLFGEIRDQNDPPHFITLLRGKLFFDLLVQIESYVKKGYFSETLIFMSKIMKIMVKKFILTLSISTKIPQNTTDANRINSFLVITYDHFQIISSIVSQTPNFLDQMKTHLVSTLRRMLHNQDIFSFLTENPKFFTEYIHFFKDLHDFNLSRELWSLVFESIYYHSGMIQDLIKQNHLKALLSLVTPKSTLPVIIYGFQTFHQILEMPYQEEIRRKGLKKKVQNERSIKSMKKDVKAFVDFLMSNGFFIYFHMIYVTCQDLDRKFINIGKLFHSISTNPACSKFYSSVIIREQYKAALEFVESYYAPRYKIKFNSKKGFYYLPKESQKSKK